MTFVEVIKALGARALMEEFKYNLLMVKQFLIIILKKDNDFDTSRYMRDLKKYIREDFNKESLKFKANVLEVLEKIHCEEC